MSSGVVIPGSSSRDLLVKNPTIVNISVATANLENVHALVGNIRRMTIKCRGTATMKLCFTEGESGTRYITLPPGSIMSEENFELPINVCFQLDKSDVVEILTWQKL